jgi:hypothetical protein
MYDSVETKFKIFIKKNYQNITLLQLDNIYIDGSYNILIDGIKENSLIKYVLSEPDMCHIVNNVIYPLKAGLCLLYVITSETTNYYQTKSNKISLNIKRKEQDKLFINYQSETENIIRLNANYGDYTNFVITGGNTDKINIVSNETICKVVKNE